MRTNHGDLCRIHRTVAPSEAVSTNQGGLISFSIEILCGFAYLVSRRWEHKQKSVAHILMGGSVGVVAEEVPSKVAKWLPLSVKSCTPESKVLAHPADSVVDALLRGSARKPARMEEDNMLSLIRKRMKGDKGFTLIELLVVIIIIAILAAIAIPTFLGQRNKAYDAAAKSLVRNAMTAMETVYVDGRDFTDANATTLHDIEPAITWASGTAAVDTYVDETTVYYTTPTSDSYTLSACSKSGKVFAVAVDKLSAGITYTPDPW